MWLRRCWNLLINSFANLSWIRRASENLLARSRKNNYYGQAKLKGWGYQYLSWYYISPSKIEIYYCDNIAKSTKEIKERNWPKIYQYWKKIGRLEQVPNALTGQLGGLIILNSELLL